MDGQGRAWSVMVLVLVCFGCARDGSGRASGRGGVGGTGAQLVAAQDGAGIGGEQERHRGCLEWAREHRREWLEMSRAEFDAAIKTRLVGRHLQRRTEGNVLARYEETLEVALPRLSWHDVLVLLVVDEIVRRPEVARDLFEQARTDRLDKGAEHGGLLTAAGAVRFVSQQDERPGDFAFVAPRGMFEADGEALAHYHFHAQSEENGEYAGPSKGDLEYAKRFSRHCVVFTSAGRGRMDVDVYFPSGVVVDLGVVER
jgi:hypothetical protein